MMKTGLLTCLIALLLFTSAHAEEGKKLREVKFSLIHAQSERIEETMPVAPKLRKSLETLFGYDKYRILGEARSELPQGKPVTFQPHPLFFIKLSRTPEKLNCYDFELIQNDESLVKGKYVPKKEVPLIIRGPFYDQGNLVLVIESEFDAK
ncbi:MAG: hypothetical protein AAF649_07230 [Verrucomicrobiota bacterium]